VQQAPAEDALMQEETAAAATAVAPADALQESTCVISAGKRLMQHQVPSPKREWERDAAAQFVCSIYPAQSRMLCPANGLP
jgi:hypothetical protein